MKKIALISGITDQDGSFLAEFLVEKEYEIHGIGEDYGAARPYFCEEVAHERADESTVNCLLCAKYKD